jgi:hypothetical protein
MKVAHHPSHAAGPARSPALTRTRATRLPRVAMKELFRAR